MNWPAKQRAVAFVPPPMTIYQCDHIYRWLSESYATQRFDNADLKVQFDELLNKLQRFELGCINLIHAEILLSEITDTAYEYRNDRVLAWLHELAILTGKVLCSPLAVDITADSQLVHRLDCLHAYHRNLVETLRLRVHLRFALRAIGQDDSKWNEQVESCELTIKEPFPIRFDDRRFQVATEGMARAFVNQYSGGTHE